MVTRRRVLIGGVAMAGAAVLAPPFVAGGLATPAGVDPVTATMNAYLSTLVPGPADDPRGTPGAVEAGGLNALQTYVPYIIPLVLADLEAVAVLSHGRTFAQLDYPQREALLVDAFADPIRSVYHLIAMAIGAGAFYADFRNRVGGNHIGFPGPSDGYLTTYSDGLSHGQPQIDAVPR